MTLRFVSTSILSSEDGIGFSKEVALETEEIKLARILAEQASNKPLFQQLAEKKQREQEEYDANTKKIFAPPKALDEDDVNYFKELEETKSKALEARSVRDEQNVSSFKEAVKKLENHKPTIIKIGNNSSNNTNKETDQTVAVPSIIKVKRKSDSKDNKQQNNEETKKPKVVVSNTNSNLLSTLSMISNYSSDDD